MSENNTGNLPVQSYLKSGGRIMLILFATIIVCILLTAGLLVLVSPGKPEPVINRKGIPPDGSISEKVFINIGGVKQGMFIRGRNIDNPVLLFLHGGPGMPTFFLAEKYPTGLENNFTVCYWEQRGAGLSYNPEDPAEDITIEQIISDAIEVTNYLRQRFGKEKIFLMGHSWGSLAGIRIAVKAPELFSAYIGVSQIVKQKESEMLAYTYMKGQYEAAGNRNMAEKLNSFPVSESDEAMIQYFKSPLRDKAMHDLGVGTMHNMKSVFKGIFLPVMMCRAYTFKEKINIWRAKLYLRSKTGLIDELFQANLDTEISDLDIPTYFISGIYDFTVNHELSKTLLEHLQAPVKGFYTFTQSAHCPMHEEPERFLRIMCEDVLNRTSTLADTLNNSIQSP